MYTRGMQFTTKDTIKADNPNTHLNATKSTTATEDAQMQEANPRDEPLSNSPQEDTSIKATKGATVKQVLQAEMVLNKDPDVAPEQIETDNPDPYLEATEEQLEEAIDQVLSDDTQLDAAIKAAKAAKVKRVLEVETDLAEDPDALLEMDEECLEKAREISYGVPFEGLSLSQKRSRENPILVPVYKTRMGLLNGGRLYKGCRRSGNRIVVNLPMYVNATIRAQQLDPVQDLLVRAELKPPGERHPNCWATQARDSDPGTRVAITVTRKEGDRLVTTYATTNSPWAPYKANTFVDWLTGIEYIRIAQEPRGYLHFQPSLRKNLPEELKFFVGGGYADDHGTRFKNQRETTVPAGVALDQHLPQATSSLPRYDQQLDSQGGDNEEDLEL